MTDSEEEAGGEAPAIDEPTATEPAVDEVDTSVAFVEPEVFLPLRFVEVVMVLPSTHPLLVLEELDPPLRQLRIPIGAPEGIAIAYAARGLSTPRPLTHELFAKTLEKLAIGLEVVRITAVDGIRYEAELYFSGPSGSEIISCRPSDGIALALRQRLPVPITVARSVLDEAGYQGASAFA